MRLEVGEDAAVAEKPKAKKESNVESTEISPGNQIQGSVATVSEAYLRTDQTILDVDIKLGESGGIK